MVLSLPLARLKSNWHKKYDIIIVSFSGGKDSTALLLGLLDMGVPIEKIQLWHQEVDGFGPRFMDWPCTQSYCTSVAKSIGVRILYQWKEGGFLREMLRKDSLTAPIKFMCQDGRIRTAGGIRGNISTRQKYPQVSMDLRVRWCSAYLKIDVAAIALNNDPGLEGMNILFLTGERREEGGFGADGKPTGRAAYKEKEPHRCSNRRHDILHWRMVIDHSEAQVWDAMRRYGVMPHPAYRLGFPRVSCMTCIFGLADQWASIRKIDRSRFDTILYYEKLLGCTIKPGMTVADQADRGTPFPPCNNAELVALALSEQYPERLARVKQTDWVLPPGAFKRGGGPA